MPHETDPRALLESREARSRAKLRGAAKSLLGDANPVSRERAGLASVVQRHPVAAAAVAVGAGFALAPSSGRTSRGSADRPQRGRFGHLLGHVLVATRLADSVSRLTSSPETTTL